MSRQRRAEIAVLALMMAAGVVVAYATDDLAFAVFWFLVIVVSSVLHFKFLPFPRLAPPRPSSVPRPSVGTSPEAVRRRKNERLGLLAFALPLAVLLAVLALVADPLAVKLAAAGLSALLVAWVALGCWIYSRRSEHWDARRTRSYERRIERLTEARRVYEAEVDPVAEREKMAKLGKRMLTIHHVPMVLTAAVLVILAPVLLAGQSSSPAVRTAGAIGSGALLAGTVALLVLAVLRRRRRRSGSGA